MVEALPEEGRQRVLSNLSAFRNLGGMPVSPKHTASTLREVWQARVGSNFNINPLHVANLFIRFFLPKPNRSYMESLREITRADLLSIVEEVLKLRSTGKPDFLAQHESRIA